MMHDCRQAAPQKQRFKNGKNMNSIYYQAAVMDISFEDIDKNEFLGVNEISAGTGRFAVYEVMRKPFFLNISLMCPACGHLFIINYYDCMWDDGCGACPNCQSGLVLSGEEVKEVFERQLHQKLDEIDLDDKASLEVLGRIIAKASILLEPLCLIFIIGFWSDRIGHYLENTAILLAMLQTYIKSKPLLIAFPPHPELCSNHYVTRLWSESGHFIVTPAALVAYDLLRPLNGHCQDNPAINWPTMYWNVRYAVNPRRMDGIRFQPKPRHARHLIDLREKKWFADSKGLLPSNGPYFHFSEEEDRSAESWRSSHGLNGDYAVFIGRDSAYLDSQYSHENWRFHDHRDMDINTYLHSMRWLAEHNIGSIRLGSIVKDFLPDNLPPGIIDYPAVTKRDQFSEFLDIHVQNKCLFTVTVSTGIDVASYLFNKPILNVNAVALAPMLITQNHPNKLWCPKKIWDLRRKRFLSLREMFASNFHVLYGSHNYKQAGLVLIDNTAEEISAVVREIYEKVVTKTWVETENELSLQQDFVRLFDEFYPGFEIKSKLAYSFFRDNAFLLDDA